MSDKELDKLFQQKFETFEPKVPANLWAAIADQLDEKPAKKKAFPIFWMAAASVVLLMFTALWLLNPKEPMKLHGKTDNGVVVLKKYADAKPVQDIEKQNPKKADVSVAVKKQDSEKVMRDATVKAPISVATTPVQREQQTQVATVKSIEPEVIGNSKPLQTLASNQTTASTPVTEQPILASYIPTENPEEHDTPKRKSRGPKSLVGLVNYVVGKVDPREDKIIELKDTDEGTEVSGINLGLLRLKSKSNSENK